MARGAGTPLFVYNTPGGVRTVINTAMCPGDVFYVNSATGTDAAGHGRSAEQPLDSISYFFSANFPTANAGDWLVVAPGHTETIAAAGSITCDIATVRLIGGSAVDGVLMPTVGSKCPVITFDGATSATIVMSAADVTWENFIFNNTQDALVVGFPVTAAYCGFYNCEFQDAGTDNTVDWITLSAAADDFKCINCTNKGTDTAGNDSFISIGATSNVRIVGLVSNGDFAAANIECTAAVVDILIDRCFLENLNAVDVNIEGYAASTGWIADCKCEIVTDGEVTWINTPGEISLYENYGVNEAGETGMIIGTASTT